MTVFDTFNPTDYTFLVLKRGGVTGNTILASHETSGIFKHRSNMVRGDNSETKDSNATLHIRPEETWLADLSYNLVGHGAQVNGTDYEIIGMTGGQNFDSGVLEHYTATLQETNYSDYVVEVEVVGGVTGG